MQDTADSAGVDAPEGGRDESLRLLVTPDRAEVRVVDHVPPGVGGARITRDRIEALLVESGVRVPPDGAAIEKVLEDLRAERSPLGALLARSISPVDGADGEARFRVRTATDIGRLAPGDRVDYHERGIVESVAAGQVIAVVTPPSDGEPGADVTGAPIPARRGRPAELRPGPGVAVSQDGATFTAAVSGMVQYTRGVLGVTDAFELPSDVDFTTGNIHMGQGSVLVRGVVRDGFRVSASGNVVVLKEVEEAAIEAGGDIDVRHGVLGGDLRAEGSICAQFATNAAIEAGGDIVVASYLYNCRATAGGRIIASSGKGIIRGGALRCPGGIEVNELGSRLETPTEVFVEAEVEAERAIVEELREISESIDLIYRQFGDEDRITSTPPEATDARTGWERVQANIRALYERKAALSRSLSDLLAEKRRNARATVSVRKVVYPGVALVLAGHRVEIGSETPRCVFYYDAEKDEVLTAPLP